MLTFWLVAWIAADYACPIGLRNVAPAIQERLCPLERRVEVYRAGGREELHAKLLELGPSAEGLRVLRCFGQVCEPETIVWRPLTGPAQKPDRRKWLWNR